MGAGKKLWGYYPTDGVWLPLQVNADGKVVADMSAINLNDLGDVNAPAPADGEVLQRDAATSKWVAVDTGSRFYTLTDVPAIWRCWDNPVSSTPRTAIVQGIAADVITLTGNHNSKFGDWGDAPEKMHADNVYVMIRNTTRGEDAWVKDTPTGITLQVTNAADIAAWVNGDIISTWSSAGGNYVELDISPCVPDGATMVFLKTQAKDSGVMVVNIGLQVSKQGFAGSWNNTFCQVTDMLVTAYPPTQITVARHIIIRDRATGAATLNHAVRPVGYLM